MASLTHFERQLMEVAQNNGHIKNVAEDLKYNAYFNQVVSTIKRGALFPDIVEEMRNNKAVATEFVIRNGLNLQYTSNELQNDEEFVRKAIEENGLALQFASANLQTNTELIKLAIKQNLQIFFQLPKTQKQDKEIIIFTLNITKRTAEEILKSIPEKLYQNDIDIIDAAVRNTNTLYKSKYHSFHTNRDLAITALENGTSYSIIDSSVQSDYEVIKKAVRHDKNCFDSIPKKFQKDPEVVSFASYHSNNLPKIQEKEFILPIVREGKIGSINSIHECLHQDKEVVLELLSKNARIYMELKLPIKGDIDVMKQAIKRDHLQARNIPNESRTEEICDFSVAINGNTIDYFDSFKDNPEIVTKAVTKNPECFRMVRYKPDNLAILAVTHTGSNLQYCTNEQKSNEEIALLAISKDPNSFSYVAPPLNANETFIIKAIKTNPTVYTKLPPSFKDNLELALLAVNGSWSNLGSVPEQLKIDHPELVSIACESDQRALRFIPESFKSNLDFVRQVLNWNYHPAWLTDDLRFTASAGKAKSARK